MMVNSKKQLRSVCQRYKIILKKRNVYNGGRKWCIDAMISFFLNTVAYSIVQYGAIRVVRCRCWGKFDRNTVKANKF